MMFTEVTAMTFSPFRQTPSAGARLFALLLLLLPLGVMAADGSIGILRGFDGSFHSVNEYTGQGKWTVVMIWASDCGVCNAEAANYVKFHQAHKDKDATILGVSLDGQAMKAEAEKFIQRHAVNFPNLIDEPERVAQWYTGLSGQPWIGTPTFLVYSPKGELRAAQVGAVPTDLIEDFMAKESAANGDNKAPATGS
jgi:peroxiredoxin